MDWLDAFTKKRFLAQASQPVDKQAPKPLKIFKLEPILTPSGVLDTEISTPGWMDVSSDYTPDQLDLDYSMDDVTDFGVDDLPDIDVEIPEIFQTTEVVDSIDLSSSTFDSGVFTVGESSEIGIDFLYDGGAYQGELAIFSLEGLDPNSDTFVQEAAERALSNSPEQGYVVISDPTEAARFSGVLPGEGDHNTGNYQGVRTFTMAKGTEFGIMLVPNGTVQEVLDGHGVGDKLPVFSMATANPNDAFHIGQLADVTGDGSTFVLEDMRVDTGSDKDYNDIVFQVRGATAEAATMDQLITDGALDEAKDWRDTDMGEALISYAEPYITPEVTILEPLPDEPLADVIISPPIDEFDPAEPIDLVISPPADEFDPAEPDGYDFPQENQPLIGVIDTGFSANSPYLDYDRITLGQDLVDGDANPLLEPGEGNEHGTHIVGVIDSGNNDAPLWVGRAVDSGQWADSLVEFVDAAKESGQPNAIVNLSFDLTQINPDGTETTRYEFTPEERAALEYARQNNVLIVAAAGNDGNVMSVLGQASQEFDNIITVGSAENLDSSVAPAKGFDRVDYSSYGYGLDIMAEGGTIDNPVLSTAGDGLGTMAGTSVATAEVTSAASQVWAANPELSYQQVIDILKSTATDLNTANWDTETGTGLLNVAAAVSLAKVTTPEVYTPEAFSIPITWGGEGKVTPTERAALSAEQIGQQPTGDTYASGYIAPFKGGATLTQDWNSNHTHNGKSAYAKDWVIADSKVYAAKSGTVIAVKEDSTIYGDSSAYANDANYVIIHHDDGYESMYLHLETGSVPIEVGDYVEAGTYIGLTGLSGWTSGEHLHFVVRNSSTKYSVPFKLDGSDANYQNPQTPTPDPSGVVSANFSASVMATAGANIRSGPGTNYAIVGGSPYQSNLEFDAWTYGETVTDVSLGTPDARWYRIKGTNNWVASAVVNGNAPGSTPLPPDNSSSSPEVVEESFSGWVGSSNGVNLRNSPSHADRGPLNEPYEKTLYFDAWTYGEVVRDLWTDEEDALWYRVAGTNYWVPSAYIAGYPGSQPPLLPPDNSDSSGGHTVSGSFLPVWQQYQGTLGNATSEVIDYSGGVSYQLFENGSIVSSQHGTFPLYGAIRQTYLGTGGLNGDLGAPTSAEVNQGNGVIKQTFENGYIIWNGAKATVYEYDDPQDDQSNVPLPDVAPDISPSNGLSANMRAFLDTIAYAEGTNYVDGYRTIFTYQTFDSFDDHPRTVFCSGNLCSDAAGRYQFLSSTWDSVRSAIGATDFSPYYQDLGAVELIKRRGALEDVENGNIQAAIEKCSWEWASFPPGRYGQPQKSMDELLQVYQDSLAKYT